MKKYMVKLHGQRFLFNNDREPNKFGFHATRYVQADSPEAAGKTAIVRIHQCVEFRTNLADEGTVHSSIDIEEVTEIGSLKFMFKKSTKGFDFYPEDD